MRRAAGRPVARSRDAEFAAKGDGSYLAARANDVKRRIDEALAELDGRPGEERESSFDKWPGMWTIRDTLINSMAHTAEHAAHAELTRDLFLAKRGSI